MSNSEPEITRILVVDDDDRFRERLALALMKRGYQVTVAAGAEEALRLLPECEPEWSIVDLRMPGTNGLELVKQLLVAAPLLRIVVLTAYGSIATALEAVRRGAWDYLQKPADVDEIVHAFRIDRSGVRPAPPIEVPTLARAEWEHINRVLTECGGSIRKTAQLLGMHRRTLQRKLAKYPVSR
ncbi:MAG: response regulator [Myxococcales bacterium]|nr:response regulator [Myxococcales bacterium]